MNVFSNSTMINTRKVEVDNMHYVLDVEATGRHPGGDHDGATGSAESAPNMLDELIYLLGKLTKHPHAHAGCDPSGSRCSGAHC